LATFRLTQVIKRPVAEVFGTVIDAGNFASWNPTIKSSRQLTPGEPGEGSQFEWELRGFGKVRQELREFERDRRVRIVPDNRSISGGHRFTFTEVGEETRVDHELDMTPRGFFKVMTPMMTITGRKNLRATAAALQRYLEQY
jgi:uncharacterized protein YndB with AHSA1/START domain